MNHRWDTSGKTPRRVRVGAQRCPECHGDGVIHIEEQYIAIFCSHCKGKGYIGEEVVGETISYSSGEVPESSLVREWREKIGSSKVEPENKARGFYRCIERFCDALEEREREVERLREQTVNQGDEIDKCYREDKELRAEVERLREVLYLAVRLNTLSRDFDPFFHMDDQGVRELDAVRERIGRLWAAREREERDG